MRRSVFGKLRAFSLVWRSKMPEAALRAENDPCLEAVDHQTAARKLQDVLSLRLPSFYRCAFRVLGNAADAEDAVQEALLAAYKHINQFRGQSQISTWLTTIVRNSALMQLRKRPRQIHFALDEQFGEEQPRSVWEGLADERPSPEDEFRNSELVARLRKCTALLSPTLRRTFQLRVIDGLTILETAPESWGCHTERSKRSWHAREQNFRGTCGQCLHQVVAEPSGYASRLTALR
jgi:RNA polymerase sigma factor (sigma-70 family)